MRTFTALLLATVTASALAAEAYKWVDADGTVHYGDKPKHSAEFMDIKPGSGSGPSSEQLGRAAECQKVKAELADYRSAAGLNEVDALGRKRELTPDERRQFLENYQKKVDEACEPPKRS